MEKSEDYKKGYQRGFLVGVSMPIIGAVMVLLIIVALL